MQRNQLLLLVGAFVLLVAGAVVVPQLLSDPELPIVRWSAGEEQEVPAEPADPASAGSDDDPALVRSSATIDGQPAGAADERIDLLMRGRVVDKFRGPVAGATVWLDFGRGGPGRGGAANRQRRVPDPVTTDADGRFAFQGQTFRSLRVSLQIAHERFAPGQFDKDVGTVAAELDLGELVLQNGGEVRGRVTDLEGNGIAGAELRLQPENANPLRFLRDRERMLPAFTTDTNGFYRRPHLTAGDWSISATAKRHTEGRSSTFAVEEDQAADVDDIRLGPGYEVTGTVRDSRGAPIAKATVVMQGDGRARGNGGAGPGGGNGGRGGPVAGGREHRATTDERGNFLLEHLPATTMRVAVAAEGFLDLRVDSVDPTVGQPLQLTMQDGLRIDGHVVDGDGSAVTMFAFRAVRLRGLPPPGQANIDVAALMARARDTSLGDAEREQARSQLAGLRDQGGGPGGRGGRGGQDNADNPGGRQGQRDLGRPERHADGRFVATGLQEGVYEVHVQSPEHARYRSAELELRNGSAPVQLEAIVDAGVFVAGVVVDSEGEPVAQARVELRTPSSFEGMGGPGGRRAGGGAAAANPGQPNTTPADLGGMAREFQRVANGAQLTLETTANAEGVFIVKHVPRGSYRLQAEASGYATARSDTFDLQADRSGFELRLGSLGVLVGTVRGLRDTEIAEARIAAVPLNGGAGGMFGRGRGNGGGGPGGGNGGGPFQSANVAADGSYRLTNLTPGEYIVRSWVGSSQDLMRELMPQFFSGSLQADVVVQGGQETRFDLTVTRPQLGSVAGSVLHNGSPASGFQVELVRADDGSQPAQPAGPGGGGRGRGGFARNLQSSVASSGTFRIENVPVGNYRLRVQSARRGGVLHEEEVLVVSEVTTERTIVLQTHTLQGTVRAEDGIDPGSLGGRVTLLPGLTAAPDDLNTSMRENPGFEARVQNGGFRFEAVKPGNYLLVLTIRGRDRTTMPIVIGGDQQLPLTAGKLSAGDAGNGGARAPRAPAATGR